MRPLYLLLLAFLLVGCGGSATATIPPTNTMMAPSPTIAATAVPLGDRDLESPLLQKGDLPGDVTTGQIKDTPQGAFTQLPKSAKTIYTVLSNGQGEVAGSITILLYDDAAAIYPQATKLFLGDEGQAVEGLGDRSLLSPQKDPIPSARVFFLRCHAIASITLAPAGTGDGDKVDDALASYAKRVDSRLKKEAC